jgi:uncharacterized protein YukE
MLLADGGGGGTPEVSGDSFTVKTTGVAPINASGMSASEIEGLFANLMPGPIAEAGAAHTQVSQVLAHIADAVVTHVTKLQQNWEGTAATSAVSAFQQLHASATTLATAAAQTGAVLSWLGSEVLPQYAGWTAPSNGIVGDVESFFGHNPQNSAAQQKMNELNQQLVAANAKLPTSVKISLPTSSSGSASSTSTAVGGPAAGSGTAVAAATGGSSGAGSAPGLTSGGGAPSGPGTISTTHGGGGSGPTLSSGGSTPGSGTRVSGLGSSTGTGTGTTGGFGTGPGAPASGSTPTVGNGGGSTNGFLPGSNGSIPGSTTPVTTDNPGTTDSSLPGTGDEGLPGSGGLPGEPGILPGTIGDGTGPGDGLGGGDVPGNLMPVNGFSGTGGMPGDNGFSSPGTLNSGLGDDLGEGLLPGDNSFMGPDGMIGMIPGDPATGGLAPNGFVDDSPYGVGGLPGESAAAGGADAAAADGAGGMPMMGVGSGNNRDEAGRNREAWLNEDADLWNGGTQAVPSLITR